MGQFQIIIPHIFNWQITFKVRIFVAFQIYFVHAFRMWDIFH